MPQEASKKSKAGRVTVIGLTCLCMLVAKSASAEMLSRPNIVIVMPDDIGHGDFACLGNPFIRTPNIDALWRESVRFTDFHVSPTCAPTRAVLLTGRHEFKNGVTHTIYERERLTLRATTVAQMLKSVGYTTGIFGKWHLGDEPDRWPDKRGFDEMFIHGGSGIGQSYPGSCGDAPVTSTWIRRSCTTASLKRHTDIVPMCFFARLNDGLIQ